jgi:hypothetical protein
MKQEEIDLLTKMYEKKGMTKDQIKMRLNHHKLVETQQKIKLTLKQDLMMPKAYSTSNPMDLRRKIKKSSFSMPTD